MLADRWSSLLEDVPLGILGVEADGTVGYANGYARSVVFDGGTDLVGEDFGELVERHQPAGESLASILDAPLARDLLLVRVDREVAGKRVRCWYSLSAVGPRLDEDKPTLMVLQEASPLVGLGRWLQRLIERSGKSERALIQQLAEEVAHLMRNPLAAMTLNTAMLNDAVTDPLGTGLAGETKGIVDDIEDAAARMADVVDRLLALARRGVHDPQRPMVHEDGFLD
ncbi:MAG: histidine kinase dimerization/phospho-acceptor domain-containing protein [Myxococcota bacterium]